MITDAEAIGLHDRATLGAPLSADEQRSLQQWYDQQDYVEAAQLAAATEGGNGAALNDAVAAAAARVRLSGERIHAISLANAKLREEIADLQQQLARRVVAPTA
jgi:hypothetical protein